MSKLDLTDSNRIVCKKCEIGEFSNETTSISVNDFDILITLKNGQNKLFKQENLNHINSNDFYLIDKDSSFNSFNQAALHSGSRKLFAALNQQEEISYKINPPSTIKNYEINSHSEEDSINEGQNS